MCLTFFYSSFVSVIIVAPMLWNKFLLVHNDIVEGPPLLTMIMTVSQ